MLLLIFFSLLLFEDEPYVLVLTNNERMEVKEAPVCLGRLCTVVLLDGEKMSLPANLIDRARTETVNKELAEQRQADAEQRAEQARKEKEKAAARERARAKKVISLEKGEDLPVSDRSLNTTSGVVVEPASNTPAGAAGPAQERTWTSEDPVFLAREKITRFEDHYEIECEVQTNVREGVSNVKVQLKVNYADGLPDEVMKRVGDLRFGAPALVAFIINRSDELIRTGYVIDYEKVE